MGSTYTTLSLEPPRTDPKEAFLSQVSPTQNTWYPILDLSGSGYLHEVRVGDSSGNTGKLEIRFTIDGGTAQTSSHDNNIVDKIPTFSSGYGRLELNFQRVRFFTFLKVEMRSTSGSPGTLYGKAYYSQV